MVFGGGKRSALDGSIKSKKIIGYCATFGIETVIFQDRFRLVAVDRYEVFQKTTLQCQLLMHESYRVVQRYVAFGVGCIREYREACHYAIMLSSG